MVICIHGFYSVEVRVRVHGALETGLRMMPHSLVATSRGQADLETIRGVVVWVGGLAGQAEEWVARRARQRDVCGWALCCAWLGC